jgi:hypothetical protein
MVEIREQKRSTTDNRNPLQQAGSLQRVLNYVGPGHWCFVAEVSSWWSTLYKTIASRDVDSSTRPWIKISCVPQMTLYSAVCASPARVRHAQAHKLECTTTNFESAAGMFADVATLKAAHELGMYYESAAAMAGAVQCNTLEVVQFLRAQGCWWSNILSYTAAARGDLAVCAYLHADGCGWSMVTAERAARHTHTETLRWLREHGCPWYKGRMPLVAAESGSVDMMLYLREEGIVFSADMLREMLKTAGACNKLAAAQWLRQQGASWPEVLRARTRVKNDVAWSGDVLLWARAEGCISLTE